MAISKRVERRNKKNKGEREEEGGRRVVFIL